MVRKILSIGWLILMIGLWFVLFFASGLSGPNPDELTSSIFASIAVFFLALPGIIGFFWERIAKYSFGLRILILLAGFAPALFFLWETFAPLEYIF